MTRDDLKNPVILNEITLPDDAPRDRAVVCVYAAGGQWKPYQAQVWGPGHTPLAAGGYCKTPGRAVESALRAAYARLADRWALA